MSYDAVVIGAGNGGLVAAATLQRAGKKALLLERHNIPGGCATSFIRGEFEFEVALHQLSGLGTTQNPFVLRQLFTELGVLDQVEFIEERELYRYVVPGEVDITLPADIKGVADALKNRFPHEAGAIDAFIALCRVITVETFIAMPKARKAGQESVLRETCPNFASYGLRSAKDVLDEFFEDPALKSTLAAYWGYLGLPPSQLSFSDLGTLIFAYSEYRPYHIKGGSQALSNALLEVFLDAGGEARFNCAATRILTNNGAIRGVLTEDGDEVACRAVVSNANSVLTYNELLDVKDAAAPIREDFKSRRVGVSGTIIYMGLDCPPEALGVTSATSFITTTLDDDAAYSATHTLEDPLYAVFTCYNFAEPSFAPKGKSNVALMALHYGEAWDDVPPEYYAKTKYAYAERLLDLGEKAFPNLRAHIEEAEVATPRTLMRYLNTPGGAIYGFDQNIFDSPLFRERHNVIDGLYLASAWSGMGGFQPTYTTGRSAARKAVAFVDSLIEKEAANV